MEGRHDLLLEEVPLRDGVVQLCLRKIDEHSCDLWGFLVTHELLYVLVDGVADDLLLLFLLGIFEVLGDEHGLDLLEVGLGVHLVDVLGVGG